MIDKRVYSVQQALEGMVNGSSVMISGFGGAGTPVSLIQALDACGARELTIMANSLRYIEAYAPQMFVDCRIRKAVASAARARGRDTANFEQQWLDGNLEIELVPQGTFVERLRAGGAGIAGFYTPTGVGTDLAEGKEIREFDGQPFVLERALTADFALLRASRADRWGNLRFHGTQENFGSSMAMAGRVAVAEVEEIVDQPLSPAQISLPGIFVQRVIELPDGRDGR